MIFRHRPSRLAKRNIKNTKRKTRKIPIKTQNKLVFCSLDLRYCFLLNSVSQCGIKQKKKIRKIIFELGSPRCVSDRSLKTENEEKKSDFLFWFFFSRKFRQSPGLTESNLPERWFILRFAYLLSFIAVIFSRSWTTFQLRRLSLENESIWSSLILFFKLHATKKHLNGSSFQSNVDTLKNIRPRNICLLLSPFLPWKQIDLFWRSKHLEEYFLWNFRITKTLISFSEANKTSTFLIVSRMFWWNSIEFLALVLSEKNLGPEVPFDSVWIDDFRSIEYLNLQRVQTKNFFLEEKKTVWPIIKTFDSIRLFAAKLSTDRFWISALLWNLMKTNLIVVNFFLPIWLFIRPCRSKLFQNNLNRKQFRIS